MNSQPDDKIIALITGISDGLVIPFAVVIGLSFAGVDKIYLLITAIVFIIIGAFAMGLAGFFSSREDEASADDSIETELWHKSMIESSEHDDMPYSKILRKEQAVSNGFYIGAGYLLAGILPVLPFMLVADTEIARLYSAIGTFTAVCSVGFLKSKFTGQSILPGILRPLLTAGLVIIAAYLISNVLI